MKQILTIALVSAVVVFAIYPWIGTMRDGIGGPSSIFGTNCVIATTTPQKIGPSKSRLLLATSSRRAWARLTATTTVWLSLDEGRPARSGHGIQVGDSGSTTLRTFEIDLDMPYTGAVYGITSSPTSTVSVTECAYPN